MDARPQSATVRAREEIVGEIVSRLKPWRRPSKTLYISATNQTADEKKQELVFRVMPSRPKNVRAAVEKEVDEVRRLIAQGPEPAMKLKKTARKALKALDALIDALNEDDVVALRASRDDFSRPMRGLREYLSAMERLVPPRKTDLTKRVCANAAFMLVTLHSEKPPTTTAGHPMREIASLLYEAATDVLAEDMERACKDCVRRIRQQMREGEAFARRMRSQ
jgi:hypothetical protein